VRGFAVVHCIGILTSMFSAVFFSRGLVNLLVRPPEEAQERVHRHRLAPRCARKAGAITKPSEETKHGIFQDPP
jgi:NADH:ubiquinone oxidoreductase subunit 2 (subunit N)